MKPLRVLQVVHGLHCGGTEMVIMNWLRNMDLNKIRFDFALYTPEDNFFGKEVLSLKSRIFTITPSKFNSGKTSWQLAYNLYRTIKSKGPFIAIHTHEEQPFVAGLQMFAAWLACIPKRFTISHVDRNVYSAKARTNVMKLFLGRLLIRLFSNHRLAVSRAAGIAMYGKYISFDLIKNGIDTSKFAFNNTVRKEIREKLRISPNTFVLGTVGRLVEQKNPLFALQIFKELQHHIKDSKLLMIGKGELKEKLIRKARDYELEERLILLQDIKDVYKYYQVMDSFILPSLFEGLGIVLIEAQCSGLPCFASDVIPEEAFVCNIQKLSLSNSAPKWAEIIFKQTRNFRRTDQTDTIKKVGFDSTEVSKSIQERYLK